MSEQFGKYTIEGVLGRGGMAEALKCRLSGLGGFDKLVVVKRILPNLVSEPEFVQMFLDEARLAANLTHPNVVQVFEIGEIDHIPYIAMEYVNGLTLHRLARAARASEAPYGYLARIASDIAEGLHYVHTARDANGASLNLVHRDVSPTNIIVSLDGVPKLLDFGVAKANAVGLHTRSGLLKGKPRYMSPEQVDGSALDARTDVFSLAVCLYEAAVGRSPFYEKGMSEGALLKLILAGKFPKPREVVPDFPQELEDVLLWAMAPRREDRCPSAEALHARLEAFCVNGPTRKDVAAWVQKAAAAEAENPVPMPQPSTPHAYASARQATPTRTASASDFEIQVEEKEIVTTTRVRLRVMTGLSVLGALALVGLLVLSLSRRDATEVATPVVAPPTPGPKIAPPPPQPVDDELAARTYLEEAEKYARAQKFSAALELLARVRTLAVKDPSTVIRVTSLGNDIERDQALIKARAALAEGDKTAAIAAARVALEKDPASEDAAEIITLARKEQAPRTTPPPPNGKKGARPVAPKEAKVTISSTPAAMLFIDGDAIARTPISLPLTAGAHRVQLQLRGYVPVETEINVVAGRDASVVIPLTEERVAEPEKPRPPEPKPDPRPSVRLVEDDARPAVRIIGDDAKPKVRIVDDAKPKVQIVDEPKPKVQVIE